TVIPGTARDPVSGMTGGSLATLGMTTKAQWRARFRGDDAPAKPRRRAVRSCCRIPASAGMASRVLSPKSLNPRFRGDDLALCARSLAAFGVADQALLFRDLALAEDVLAV